MNEPPPAPPPPDSTKPLRVFLGIAALFGPGFLAAIGTFMGFMLVMAADAGIKDKETAERAWAMIFVFLGLLALSGLPLGVAAWSKTFRKPALIAGGVAFLGGVGGAVTCVAVFLKAVAG